MARQFFFWPAPKKVCPITGLNETCPLTVNENELIRQYGSLRVKEKAKCFTIPGVKE